MDDMKKQGTEKEKTAVISISTVAATSNLVALHLRTAGRRVKPYVHRASMPVADCCDQTTQWEEVVSRGLSSDFVKLLKFDGHCVFDILPPRF